MDKQHQTSINRQTAMNKQQQTNNRQITISQTHNTEETEENTESSKKPACWITTKIVETLSNHIQILDAETGHSI